MLIKKKRFKDNQIKVDKPKRKVKIKESKIETTNNGLLRKREIIDRDDLPVTNTTVDHNFLFDQPSHLAEVQNKIIGSNAAVYYAEPMFNYLAPEWERFFETKDDLDKPSLYIENDFSSDNDRFANFIVGRETVKNSTQK